MQYPFFRVDRASSLSLQDQLREKLVTAIIEGYYPPGRALPSTRKLSVSLGVSRNTVVAAYQSLVDEEILVSRERSRFFINDHLNLAPLMETLDSTRRKTENQDAKPDWSKRFKKTSPAAKPAAALGSSLVETKYNFAYGVIEQALFPLKAWRYCTRKTLARSKIDDSTWIRAKEDDPMLLDMLRQVVLPLRGIAARDGEILITSGQQSALFLLARLLSDSQSVIAHENPIASEIRNSLSASGARLLPTRVDESGLLPCSALVESDICYLQPASQYPTLAQLSAAQRTEILTWAQDSDGLIIENDDEGIFSYLGEALPALKAEDQHQRVLHCGSFSGVIGQGLQLGYIVAPRVVIGQLKELRNSMLRPPPCNNQRTLAWFIASGYYESAVLRLNKAYKSKWKAMRAALRQRLPQCMTCVPQSGGGFWLKLPPEADLIQIERQCRVEGILLTPQDSWHGTQGDAQHLLLGFTAIPAEDIAAGVERLARVLRAASAASRSSSAA